MVAGRGVAQDTVVAAPLTSTLPCRLLLLLTLLRELNVLGGSVEGPAEGGGLRVGLHPAGHIDGLVMCGTVDPLLSGRARGHNCRDESTVGKEL